VAEADFATVAHAGSGPVAQPNCAPVAHTHHPPYHV